MSDVRITVCVPTIGRDTLGRALQSCEAFDEILVDFNRDADYGYQARNRMLKKATGTHIAFLDDDDVFVDGAYETFRDHAFDRPVIAQMRLNGGQTIWSQPRLFYGNVGTPCILVPNRQDAMGVWRGWQGASSGGDCQFIHECVEGMGAPKFLERIVAHVRPD